jgi:hypothetical protein
MSETVPKRPSAACRGLHLSANSVRSQYVLSEGTLQHVVAAAGHDQLALASALVSLPPPMARTIGPSKE